MSPLLVEKRRVSHPRAAKDLFVAKQLSASQSTDKNGSGQKRPRSVASTPDEVLLISPAESSALSARLEAKHVAALLNFSSPGTPEEPTMTVNELEDPPEERISRSGSGPPASSAPTSIPWASESSQLMPLNNRIGKVVHRADSCEGVDRGRVVSSSVSGLVGKRTYMVAFASDDEEEMSSEELQANLVPSPPHASAGNAKRIVSAVTFTTAKNLLRQTPELNPSAVGNADRSALMKPLARNSLSRQAKESIVAKVVQSTAELFSPQNQAKQKRRVHRKPDLEVAILPTRVAMTAKHLGRPSQEASASDCSKTNKGKERANR